MQRESVGGGKTIDFAQYLAIFDNIIKMNEIADCFKWSSQWSIHCGLVRQM